MKATNICQNKNLNNHETKSFRVADDFEYCPDRFIDS